MEPIEGQGQKCLDATAQEAIGRLKGPIDLAVAPGGLGRILHPPMGSEGGAQIGRAGLTGGACADGNDHIGDNGKGVPGFAGEPLHREAFLSQKGQASGMDRAGGMASGTHRPKTCRGEMVKGGFRQNRPTGISRAKKEDVHRDLHSLLKT